MIREKTPIVIDEMLLCEWKEVQYEELPAAVQDQYTVPGRSAGLRKA